MKIRNTFIIFGVSGFWHGANWTFVIWGLLNAIYFLPLLLTNRNRNNMEVVAAGKYFPTLRELWSMTSTFSLTVFAWIFFRAENIHHAISYISEIFSESLFSIPRFSVKISELLTILILILIFFIVEWIGREQQFAIERIGEKHHRFWRYTFYYSIVISILWFGGKEQEFIYFQF